MGTTMNDYDNSYYFQIGDDLKMKKVARLRVPQDEFVPPNKASIESNVGVRTTGRIKKPKAVFDPSDNYVPRAQRVTQVIVQQQQVSSPKAITTSSPTTAVTREKQRERSLSTGSNASNNSSNQDGDICIICLKREPRRGGNYRNRLLTCINCNQKVHRRCAGTDFYESAPVRQSYKCENCRTCDICENNEQSSKRNGEMMTCAKCLSSYHVACHTPKVTKFQQTQRNWKCFRCVPNATSPVGNNSNTSKDESMPVTVIRQIIGYDANMQPLPKTQSNSQVVSQQVQKTVQSTRERQQEQKQQLPSKAQVHNNNKADEQVKDQPKASSPAISEISFSSSEASDADEEYTYIEKKKRKLMRDLNNSNGNGNNDQGNGNVDIDMESNVAADTEQKEKPAVFNRMIDDLPKREDVRTWSVEKLSNYIKKFFPNEAQVFKEHEIDGNALLLLKRSDVVKKLPLKLGPSLRLYSFILKIQTQKLNDPTLGWDCSVDTLLSSAE